MPFVPTRQYAQNLDAADELAPFGSQFYKPPGQIYLDGNSLGLLSLPAEAALLRALDDWKQFGVAGWTDADPPWFTLAEDLAAQTALLLGAHPDEVCLANSTTVNLHQLLATLFQPNGARAKILTDALSFPSDIYALQSHLQLRGLDPATHLVTVPSRDGLTLDEGEIIDYMTPDIALVLLPAVVYTSGQLLDMARLTQEAHRRNILIGFDCAHSIGAVPHQISTWGVDFAVWCSYKYLNAGPGAVGGLYLNRRHANRAPGLAGWWGANKESQFAMSHTLHPAEGAGRLQIGTPHILSLVPLQGSLELFAQAGIENLRAKSLCLTDYLMQLIETLFPEYGFAFGNPREHRRRGGHVALLHPAAAPISRALREVGVIPDFRPPNIIRLAPVPLYTSFLDCWDAVQRLQTIMAEKQYAVWETGREIVP